MNVASPMIDPARWGDFSDIRTNSVAKRQSIASGAWSGTIEEKFRWEFLGVALDYWNVLEIDFTVGPRQTSVEFKLDKSMSGGLAFEEGFLRLEGVSKLGVTGLTSKKTLCYGAGSKWCCLPTWALEKILLVWLTVTTTEYALRMVGSAGPGLTDAAADIAFAQLQAAQLDFYTQVYGVAR